mmetsp:Transcript_117337/g.326258  ORF Transcript_117337/g.326258 Transcript_117337/m.326258 type:complete len:213 (-) Transcript_117337:121-759(-)
MPGERRDLQAFPVQQRLTSGGFCGLRHAGALFAQHAPRADMVPAVARRDGLRGCLVLLLGARGLAGASRPASPVPRSGGRDGHHLVEQPTRFRPAGVRWLPGAARVRPRRIIALGLADEEDLQELPELHGGEVAAAVPVGERRDLAAGARCVEHAVPRPTPSAGGAPPRGLRPLPGALAALLLGGSTVAIDALRLCLAFASASGASRAAASS